MQKFAAALAEVPSILAQVSLAARTDRRVRYEDGYLVVPNDLAADFASADPSQPLPTPVPDITASQARRWLLSIGKTSADIEALIATLPEPSRGNAMIQWEYETVFRRSMPLFDQLGPALGLSPQQMDDAFRAASLL